MEFQQATGLPCGPFPPAAALEAAANHAEDESPYWYKLIGGKLGCITVKQIVERLKREPNMPAWQKFRLALIVLVEGVLLCRNQPVRPAVEVVEMVKDIDFFLNYPWGRHSFQRIMRSVRLLVTYPRPRQPEFELGGPVDIHVCHMERLLVSGFAFTKSVWHGGYASLPLMSAPRKRKTAPSDSETCSTDSDDGGPTTTHCRSKKTSTSHQAVEKIV
ncbi:unnamed protein product, partial [Arabidopsis halleri]